MQVASRPWLPLRHGKNMPSGRQSLRWKKRNSLQYLQMVMVFSVLPKKWAAQTRWWECVCYDVGELALTDEDKMRAWVEHYVRLLNVEFECPSDELPEVSPTAGTWGTGKRWWKSMKCSSALCLAAVRVPRKLIRGVDVEEWAECVIQGMYCNVCCHVRVDGQCSEEFGVQGVLRQALFLAHYSSSCCWKCFHMSSAL